MRLGSLGSKVRSVRAAFRSLARAYWTRQISRLQRSPYSPTSRSSASRRSFSYGRRGVLNVLRSVVRCSNEVKKRQQHGQRQTPSKEFELGWFLSSSEQLLGVRGATQSKRSGWLAILKNKYCLSKIRVLDRPGLKMSQLQPRISFTTKQKSPWRPWPRSSFTYSFCALRWSAWWNNYIR